MHLLVGIEPDEAVLGVDRDPLVDRIYQLLNRLALEVGGTLHVLLEKLRVVQLGEAGVQPVLENVADRDELHVRVAAQQVGDGLCAAAAAADETGPQARGAGAADKLRLDDGEGRRSGGGVPEERSPGDRVGFRLHGDSLVCPRSSFGYRGNNIIELFTTLVMRSRGMLKGWPGGLR